MVRRIGSPATYRRRGAKEGLAGFSPCASDLARVLLAVPDTTPERLMFRTHTFGGFALRTFDVLVAALIFTALT
jgi:hypothetical protein